MKRKLYRRVREFPFAPILPLKQSVAMFILDEEEEYLRQIDELKQSTAKKDAELSQLRTELAEAIKVRNRLYNVTPNG